MSNSSVAIKATLNLRGQKYPGVILDVDGFKYLRLVMNSEEVAYLDRGQYVEGISRFEQRVLGYQSEANTTEGNHKYLTDLAQFILSRVEDDRAARNEVVLRLLERFRTLPEELVFWDAAREFGGLNLNMVELVQIIVGILNPALQMVKEKRSEELAPVVELEENWQQRMKELGQEAEVKTPAVIQEEIAVEPALMSQEEVVDRLTQLQQIQELEAQLKVLRAPAELDDVEF